MSKKLFFLISFVLLVGLNGTARADAIEVNNPGFEYDMNGAQITQQVWCGQMGGWGYRNESDWGGADAYMFATVGTNFTGFQAVDGNVAFASSTLDVLPDDAVQIYQILDDPNAIIAAGYRYTLKFNAINPSETVASHDVNAALFYSTGAGSLNDVVLASSRTPLLMTELDYNDWDEITLAYLAETGAGSIGERLGIRLSVPGSPDWPAGHWNMIDNVRLNRVLAVEAYDPYPDANAKDVAKNVTLGWAPGTLVQSTGGHEVYFGTDETTVDNATTSNTTGLLHQATRDVNNYTVPSTLVLGNTYYWRVDEVNDLEGASPWKGPVWNFRVTGYATNPSPYDEEVDVPFINQSLIWTAGTEATSHDVYLGIDANDVADANTNSTEFKGNQVIGDTDYPLTGLVVHETYYWRIDERSAVHPTGLKGDVWSFTVGPFIVVDNFDSYTNQTSLWNVWDDYWVNGSDGLVFVESDEVRSGKSMSFTFENTTTSGSGPSTYWVGSWTDAQDMTELDVGTDWTIGGVESLFMYVRGDPCNGPFADVGGKAPIWGAITPWVELEDTSSNVGIVLYDDPNDLVVADWHEWNIDLNYFQDVCSVTLSAIDRFTIGIGGINGGQDAAPIKGYVGQAYFEDIRVYPPRCRPDLGFLTGDLTGDCTVDEFDLEIMSDEWLVSDYEVVATPPASPPEVWYRFDDGAGSTVVKNDGSWSGYDMTIGNPPASDEPAWTSDVAPVLDPCDPNYALSFTRSNDEHLDIPNDAASKFVGTQNMSITAWVKPVTDMGEWDWPSIVESRKDSDSGMASGFGFAGWGQLIYWWNNIYWDWPTDLWVPTGEWTFVAMAVEPTQATIYMSDGTNVDSATNVETHVALVDWDSTYNNLIGTNTSGGHPGSTFDGKIDDVRLYNKTLTAGEIDGLAGISYIPNTSVANIAPKTPPPTAYDPNDPDIVNFVDYEVLADNWLSANLWP